MPPLVELTQVTVGFPGHPVLRDVTLTILPGEALALLGPNGSGKTALLKTVAGILSPLAGEVRRRAAPGHEAVVVGYVPQRATVSGLLPLTVSEVVEMGTYGTLRPWQLLGRDEKERVACAMEQVGVAGLHRKVYADLSGGQQQRVLIARALAAAPALLIMDEPLASLDRDSVRAMIGLLARLRAEGGLAILWADHLVPALREVVHDALVIEETGWRRVRLDAALDDKELLLSSGERAAHE